MKFLKRTSKKARDSANATNRAELDSRIEQLSSMAAEHRSILTDVANHTKEIAEDITLKLRNDLIDKMREMEATAGIIHDALLICDENRNVLTMNYVAENLLQRSAPFGLGEQITVDGYDFWDALILTPEHARVTRGDGSIVTCSLNVVRVEKSTGEANYIVLIHGEEATATVAHIQSSGTLLVQNGYITACNPEVQTLLGYAGRDFIGLEFIQMLAPSERPFVAQHVLVDQLETTFDTVLFTHEQSRLFCKMAVSFVDLPEGRSMIISIDNVGEDVMDRKVDVIKCFGDDFFFRSSSYITSGDDMVMYLTPDFIIKFVNEPMRLRLACDKKDLTGLPLESVLSSTEYKIASMHFQTLTINDNERSISMHLKNTNSGAHQEWTDRASFDSEGNVIEYRRSGSMAN